MQLYLTLIKLEDNTRDLVDLLSPFSYEVKDCGYLYTADCTKSHLYLVVELEDEEAIIFSLKHNVKLTPTIHRVPYLRDFKSFGHFSGMVQLI